MLFRVPKYSIIMKTRSVKCLSLVLMNLLFVVASFPQNVQDLEIGKITEFLTNLIHNGFLTSRRRLQAK